MSRLALAFVLSTSLIACGPGDAYADPVIRPAASPDTGVPRVASAFAGKWVEASSKRVMTTVTDGGLLSIKGLCADGSGKLDIIGRDRVINWAGDLVCPAPPGLCSAAVLHYSSAIFTLTDDNSIDVSGIGYVSGCGEPTRSPVAFHFVRQVTATAH